MVPLSEACSLPRYTLDYQLAGLVNQRSPLRKLYSCEWTCATKGRRRLVDLDLKGTPLAETGHEALGNWPEEIELPSLPFPIKDNCVLPGFLSTVCPCARALSF